MCINCTFFMHLRKQVNPCNFFKNYTKKLLFRCTSNAYICSVGPFKRYVQPDVPKHICFAEHEFRVFLLALNLQQRFLVKIFWGLGLKRWVQADFSYFSFSRTAMEKRKLERGSTLFIFYIHQGTLYFENFRIRKNWFYHLKIYVS